MGFLAGFGSDPFQSDYLDHNAGQINNLIQGVVTATGQVMAPATVSSPHVRLSLTVVPKSDQDDPLGAPRKGSLDQLTRLPSAWRD